MFRTTETVKTAPAKIFAHLVFDVDQPKGHQSDDDA